MSKPVGVIGAGSFGLTLAHLASFNEEVIIYSRREAVIDSINNDHILKGYTLAPTVKASSDLQLICDKCQLIIPVIPSNEFRNVMRKMSPFLGPQHFIIHGTKGLDYPELDLMEDGIQLSKDQVFTMSEVIQQETGLIRIGCLAGPNLSKEILAGKPAAAVIASSFNEVVHAGTKALKSNHFYIFHSNQLEGTELVGAFKNIFAIAAGILQGADMGKNAYGLLITRAMREMVNFLSLLGSDKTAALGTAGIGDLVATSASGDSRNFTFGTKMATGKKLEEIMETQNELAEGVRTLKAAYLLSKEYKIDAPITNLLYQVVFQGIDIRRAVRFMMSYPFAEDVDYM